MKLSKLEKYGSKFLFLMLIMVNIVACGDGGSTSTANTKVSTSKMNATLTVNSGESVKGQASFFCSGDTFSIYLRKDKNMFSMDLPRNISLGEHVYLEERYKTNTDLITMKYQDFSNSVAYGYGSGEIDINSVPTQEGEHFSGVIKAQLNSKKSGAVDVIVDFDIVAGFQAFDECP